MRFTAIAIPACLAAAAAFAEPARASHHHYDPAVLCATARELRQAGDEEGARILLARVQRLAPGHACGTRPSAPGPSEARAPSAPPAVAPEPPRLWPARK